VLWRLLEEVLSDAWGGWTGPESVEWGRKKAVVPGGWKPQGADRPITDESRKYTVFVPPAEMDTLRSLLRKAANSFDQTGDSLECSRTARTSHSNIGRRLPGMTFRWKALRSRRARL
jgi:hypothetical protein